VTGATVGGAVNAALNGGNPFLAGLIGGFSAGVLGGLMPPGFESPALQLASATAASHLGVFASGFAPGMSGGGGNFTPGLQLAQADTVGCDVCEDPVFSAARIGAWWDFEGGFGGRRGRLRGLPAGGNPAEQEAIRRAREARAQSWGIIDKDVPERALEIYKAIQARDGKALPGYEGGRTFKNREGLLPAGQYKEYDVYPRVPGDNRGQERIVIEQTTGQGYYTPDHYTTFIPLKR
jgi:guanyl-specific ribonuclease Sa